MHKRGTPGRKTGKNKHEDSKNELMAYWYLELKNRNGNNFEIEISWYFLASYIKIS